MTDLITAAGVAVFGGIFAFCFLTLLRLRKSGHRIADDVLRSGFDGKAWLNGELPDQEHGSTVSVAEGMRARATANGIIITSTRTLSREVI